MYLDTIIKLEALSSLLNEVVRPYDQKPYRTRASLSLDDFHLQNLIGRRPSHVREFYVNEEEFFDPEYDFDFTNLPDTAACFRGDEYYKRPKGWYRIALKVKGKYPNGDAWLGPRGWRSHSAPGEWPVSYHGTSLDGSRGIIRSHYKAGPRNKYGRGIYSTPDIQVAEREEYAKTFRSDSTGKSYKVILQNRIDPSERVVCQQANYWLVPVDESASEEEERLIVVRSIRPYGILIKET
ncbi:uncharacterized protein LOC142877143 [Nelusetta ayraudi]|uniref:uncharacterized protein LOC142877143 n=1 Tax=Nelusetta ayraudi TaxID=303726 RepID=UPI003F7119E0